jgi:hypothetical protein
MRFLPLLVLLALVLPAQAQVNESGVYIDPNPGQRDWRADLNVTGNQVESIVTNYGLIGKGNGSINQAGVWPKGTGHGHLHMMTGLIGARVPNASGVETVIVSDGYLEGGQDALTESDGRIEWKFQPKPGYFNRDIAEPRIANSLSLETWPATWPDKPAEWDGAWNGFFGLNQFNSDQETFYVMDDWSNREFNFFPFGQGQPDKRGLGLQVDVRLFQWAQPLAKDILFMQYAVSNAGDVPYTSSLSGNPIFFGGYTDTNPSGSGASDDAAAFDNQQDIVYGYSFTGQGTWSQFREIPPGYVGWKFLESPSISGDGIDNDNDGLVDESRDNDAGQLITGPCGIYGPVQEHWSGDEDCDWNPALDDKGADGIGPDEEGYPGPDEGEGDGRPTQGEPNFGRLDKDESDQVGLTSFFAPLFGTVDVRDEDGVWDRLQPGFFDVPQQSVNQIWIFGSGPFDLEPGRTERFSTAFLWGANEDAMFRTSQVAQRIYDADYRFARPPRQPELQAIAGDGRVTLIWDDLAEQSRDPIYGRDFEGYRIIKSTDPQFLDAQDVTDAFGNAVYKRSIAQFDKVNGLTGPHPLQFGEEIDLPNGVHYYMGDDTGLQHSYVDTDVVNGRTYYYAVLSYDAGYDFSFDERGISDIPNLFPISPSESPASITVQNGEIVNFDRNTASATPNPNPTDEAGGRLADGNVLVQTAGPATGTVTAEVVARDLLRDARYTVSFDQRRTTSAVEYATRSVTITRDDGTVVLESEPVPVSADSTQRSRFSVELLGEGLVLTFDNQTPTLADAQMRSGWTPGSRTNYDVTVDVNRSFDFPDGVVQPVNLAIAFGDTSGAALDTAFTSTTGRITAPTYFRVFDVATGEDLDFIFNEDRLTENGQVDTTEFIQVAFRNEPTDRRFSRSWELSFGAPVGANGVRLPDAQIVRPQPGDTFLLRTRVPFGERDAFSFGTQALTRLTDVDENVLDEVRVVPNPYRVANAAETASSLTGARERKLFFRGLPTQATVQIFTASGVFVQEIQGANGVATWDLTTRDGLEAAYGLYFYHVRADGIGEKVGKFAIIN